MFSHDNQQSYDDPHLLLPLPIRLRLASGKPSVEASTVHGGGAQHDWQLDSGGSRGLHLMLIVKSNSEDIWPTFCFCRIVIMSHLFSLNRTEPLNIVGESSWGNRHLKDAIEFLFLLSFQ